MTETPRPAERTGTVDLPPDERELLATWDAYHARHLYDRAFTKARAEGNEEGARVTAARLAEMPAVSALDALAANRRLVDLLIGRRWYVMQAAVEEGASWSEVALAVGYEETEARDEYREAIDRQAKYVGDLHDADRAEAALAKGNRPRVDVPRADAPAEVVAECKEVGQ